MEKRYNTNGSRIFVPTWVTIAGLSLLGVAAVATSLAALLR